MKNIRNGERFVSRSVLFLRNFEEDDIYTGGVSFSILYVYALCKLKGEYGTGAAVYRHAELE